MWSYEKRLEFPVNIKEPNAMLAKAIISQYGGPNGEMGASMRYLSQRYSMPYREVAGLLTDIGREASEMAQDNCAPNRISKTTAVALWGSSQDTWGFTVNPGDL